MNKKTIAIVGLGLIGGSMALALRRSSRYILYGLDSDPVTLMNALKRSAVDKAGGAELLARADRQSRRFRNRYVHMTSQRYTLDDVRAYGAQWRAALRASKERRKAARKAGHSAK